MTHKQLLAAIEKNNLFFGCSFKEDELTPCVFRRGDEITDDCAGIPSAGIVISGRIEVYSIAPDTSEIILSSLSEGDSFGISCLFGNNSLETRLVCLSRCEIVFIPKRVLAQKILEDKTLANRYMTLLNTKINFLIKRIERLTVQSSKAKLADYLLSRMNHDSTVLLDRSKERLAKGLGISRAALFREFSELENSKIIEKENKCVKILKHDELLKLATQKSKGEIHK